ncbi:MAG: CDP-alcohol phosphatidyltransferase family protein [Syntrophobacterales bacterium]|nr:MAG: CDP-alcohol phosphatidyltransferase family protein [Syntrophobacterales bacterium]
MRSWNSKLNLVANALIPEALHPNHLTYLRLIAVPTLILFNYYHAQFTWMFIIVLLALLTDFFDGATARNRRQVTHLGTVLDPMADKLLAFTALTILLYRGIVHWTLILWMCLMESHLAILPVTDSLGRLLGKSKNPSKTWIPRIAPNSYGKMKVLLYSISLCLLFLGPAIESEGMVSWGLYLAYAGVFFGALALVTYLLNWFTGED